MYDHKKKFLPVKNCTEKVMQKSVNKEKIKIAKSQKKKNH